MRTVKRSVLPRRWVLSCARVGVRSHERAVRKSQATQPRQLVQCPAKITTAIARTRFAPDTTMSILRCGCWQTTQCRGCAPSSELGRRTSRFETSTELPDGTRGAGPVGESGASESVFRSSGLREGASRRGAQDNAAIVRSASIYVSTSISTLWCVHVCVCVCHRVCVQLAPALRLPRAPG